MLNGAVISVSDGKKDENNDLYVDKQPVSLKNKQQKPSVKKTETAQTETKKVEKPEQPQKSVEQSLQDAPTASGVLGQDETTSQQMDMFGMFAGNNGYKRAKQIASKFMEQAVEVYDEFEKSKSKIAFNKQQMLKQTNEYLQSLIVAKELTQVGGANENNVSFAIEIGWFGNVIEGTKSVDALKQKVRTKLLEVPNIFMLSVVLDVRTKSQNSKSLYQKLNKFYLEVYPNDQTGFNVLTKPVQSFFQKQQITV